MTVTGAMCSPVRSDGTTGQHQQEQLATEHLRDDQKYRGGQPQQRAHESSLPEVRAPTVGPGHRSSSAPHEGRGRSVVVGRCGDEVEEFLDRPEQIDLEIAKI